MGDDKYEYFYKALHTADKLHIAEWLGEYRYLEEEIEKEEFVHSASTSLDRDSSEKACS